MLKQDSTHTWYSSENLKDLTACPTRQSWLTTPGSLTARLKSICPELSVNVLSEKIAQPRPDEAVALQLMPNQTAWIRCVLLKCPSLAFSQNWIYARTVVPNLNEKNPWQNLKQLGNKPLGEVLFELNAIERTPFLFTQVRLSELPYLDSHLKEDNNTLGLLRRSLFRQQQAPLLLTEVFLPDLWDTRNDGNSI